MSDHRADAVGSVARHLCGVPVDHPLRVAVDGITASGKSTLSRELAEAVVSLGRPAVHLSMDGFHHERAHRHRRGRLSARGYYDDAYDFPALAREVLAPLGPGGDGRYRVRVIDLVNDEEVDDPRVEAPADAVLVVDGSFLQRPVLAGLWDQVVFVDTGFSVARDRGVRRDADAFGGPEQAGLAFDERYHAAGRLYVDEVSPREHATVVVGNDDLEHPRVDIPRRPRHAPPPAC